MALKIGKIEKFLNDEIQKKKGLLMAVIDPLDHPSIDAAAKAGGAASEAGADIVLVGGSIGVQGPLLDQVCKQIKQASSVPVILFPGNVSTISKEADAVYYMSMLNSRNPYWISGAQAIASFTVKQLGIEPLPVGYIVVSPGGTVGWVGDANLVPRNKPQIAAALALGGQYMGHRIIITDAGSNPKDGPIPVEMVAAVAKSIVVPYIVAGGIRTPEQAKAIIAAGADAIQVGTAFEAGDVKKKVSEMARAVREGGKLKKK